jgi:hypothetical protein
MTDRPLSDVILQAPEDFTPAHPRRAPWHQPTIRRYQLASTGNVAVVPLEVARVCLRRLGRPSWEQDWLEPADWTRAGWGVAPAA